MGARLTVGWIKTTLFRLTTKKKKIKPKSQTGLKNFLSLSGILETTGHASAFVLTQRADGANPSSAFHSKMQQHSQALTKEAITKASQSLDLNQLVQIFSCSLWLDSRLLLPDYFSLEKKREKRKACFSDEGTAVLSTGCYSFPRNSLGSQNDLQ